MSALSDLPIGGTGQVVRIDGTDDVCLRLLEMGLTPGADVCLRGKAPLGDPIEIELRGYRLSLRRSEASRVEIKTF